MKYKISVRVDQIVTSELELLVLAGSEEEAMAVTREALSEYPEAVSNESLLRIRATKKRHWIPRSIDFLRTKAIKNA